MGGVQTGRDNKVCAELRSSLETIRDYVRDKKPKALDDAVHMLNVIEVIATEATAAK